jgi:hypothetical protein
METYMNVRNTSNSGGSAVRNISRVLLFSLVTLVGMGSAFGQDSNNLKFKGAIGVIPVTGVSATGTANLNVVRGVNPGAPWQITAFDAVISPDGHIKAVGRGLLLATGNGIGTNANQSVHATLFCGPAATASAHNSTLTGVHLQANGDFAIDDVLKPAPPTVCETPVLLIRNVGGVWFAAGIQKLN